LFAFNAASQDKSSDPEEMNGWASESGQDEAGNSYFYEGKVLHQSFKRSFEEHIADCYNMEADSAAKETCVKELIEPEPEPAAWTSKFDENSLALLNNSPDMQFEALVILQPMEMQRVPDLMLEYKSMVDFGIISRKELKDSLQAQWKQNVADYEKLVEAEMKAIPGLEILNWLESTPAAMCLLNMHSVKVLESTDFVKRVAVSDPNAKDEPLGLTQTVLEHMQLHNNYYVKDSGGAGYDGEWPSERGTWGELTAAVIDATGFNYNHLVFKDGTGTDTRINGMYICDTTCASGNPTPTDTDDEGHDSHGTRLAWVLAGDLRDGQDPNIANEEPQQDRSGICPECGIRFYKSSLDNSLDHAVSSGVDLAVLSWSYGSDCAGTSTSALLANEEYKNGVLLVVAAGNGNHYGDCNVADPADATSSLTIGAHGNGGDDTVTELDTSGLMDTKHDINDPNNTDLNFGTAKGGHLYYSNRTRTIIDLLTPGFVKYYPMFNDNNGYITASHNSTSMANPKAAAALMNLLHQRYDSGSTVIALPGVQKAIMLMMGDRAAGDGSVHNLAGFNDTWGAGRLNMRLLNDTGLDSPAGSCYGYECVSQDEEVILPINSNVALSSDVDRLKAVIWWYTDSFTNPIPNKMNLYVEYESSPGNWTVIRQDQSSDLKKRVYASGSEIQGRKVRLRIWGYDVNSSHDDRGTCVNGTARIYYSYIWEDNDRDDGTPADFSTINGL